MVKSNDDTHEELEAHDGHEDSLGWFLRDHRIFVAIVHVTSARPFEDAIPSTF
jgi:hypothetical protein